MIGLSAQFAHI